MIETRSSPLRFPVTRLVIVGGALCLLMGAAWLVPIGAQWWWGVGFSGTALSKSGGLRNCVRSLD